jgi:beta-glucuronidase
VIGASWWSYNDYLSRHDGTNPDGTRPWGLVRGDRSKRVLYKAHQTGMAPVTVEKVSWVTGSEGVHTVTLRVTARLDFPAYALTKYQLRAGTTPLTIPDLQPGQSVNLIVPVRGFDKTLTVDVIKPTGFLILTQFIDSTNDTRAGNR